MALTNTQPAEASSFGMTFSEMSRLTRAMMMEAPSSTPRIGRKESARYSKKESSQATLPRALERASALTSALLFWPSPDAEAAPAFGHFGQMHDVFVHGGHAAADDDLETVTALRDRAEHALHMFEGVLVHLGRVRQLEAQSGGAMRQTANVFRSADRSDDLRCERVSHPDFLSISFRWDSIRRSAAFLQQKKTRNMAITQCHIPGLASKNVDLQPCMSRISLETIHYRRDDCANRRASATLKPPIPIIHGDTSETCTKQKTYSSHIVG